MTDTYEKAELVKCWVVTKKYKIKPIWIVDSKPEDILHTHKNKQYDREDVFLSSLDAILYALEKENIERGKLEARLMKLEAIRDRLQDRYDRFMDRAMMRRGQ